MACLPDPVDGPFSDSAERVRLISWQGGSAELTRGEAGRDLCVTRSALGCQLRTLAVLDSISEIDLLDSFTQLLVCVSGVLEQRPHSVDDED